MARLNVLCLAFACLATACGDSDSSHLGSTKPITIQLNWFHDPTFVGEYLLIEEVGDITLRAGGPSISPIAEVLGQRADMAIVGADLFLKQLEEDLASKGSSDLRCVFVDLQRNPVGWVLHPDAGRRRGLKIEQPPEERNEWLADEIDSRAIRIGDKRGTETTAVWLQWRDQMGISKETTVEPVGFDASVVLAAPDLAFPVYLNEEPFKLSEKIGEPVFVFDPAVDGVRMYGNVLIAHRDWVSEQPQRLKRFQSDLASAWKRALHAPDTAVDAVMRYYEGVSRPTVEGQVAKTLEFVFFETESPGVMEVTPQGKWASTLAALHNAESLRGTLTLDDVVAHLVQPAG